jgi:DNA-binding NtrC family response regulator
MTAPARILIIDDDRAFRVGTGALLTDEGYDVTAVESGEAGLAALEEDRFDLVLLDLRMEGMSGLEVLEQVRAGGSRIPVVMLTGYATVDTAVEALKRGANDYLTKPCDNDHLRAKIRTTLARHRLPPGEGTSRITATSEEMRGVLEAIAKVAPTDATVLVRGATGTGKELVARAIHESSPRADRAFLPVNCSALAEGVLESELFGHARGAFTGAVADRRGVFEEASGGTIFLDEIGDVSPAMQAKLLRVLQEREVTPVGTARPVQVDVRVIAATHQDLERLVEEDRFRSDLYFRLKVFQVVLPDLRDRPDDIPSLVSSAVERWNRQVRDPERRVTGWTPEAEAALLAYDWPGNVRELMAAVEHACINAQGGEIGVADLPGEILGGGRDTEGRATAGRDGADPAADSRRYQAPDPESERRAIIEALRKAEGNRTRAAADLGMGRTTLWQKLKAYGIS